MTTNSDSLKKTISENISEYVEAGENTTEKGKLWTKWLLINYYGIPESQTYDLIIDGASDNGIDAFIENEDENPIVIQCKYECSHGKDEYDNMVGRKQRLLNAPLDDFPDRIKPYIVKIQAATDFEIVYATNKEFTCNPAPITILDLSEIADEIQRRFLRPWEGKEYDLKIENQLEHNGSFISVVKMNDYEKFIQKTQDYVFDSNIRQFLSFRSRINKKIRDTLEDDIEHFFHYNNGVTIVASEAKLVDGNTIHMVEPQVVNGAQTSTVILRAEKEGINLDDGFVSVTIIEEKEKDVRNYITKFRNSQNAVKGKDLVSLVEELEAVQVEMSLIKDNNDYQGYFFEVQPGAFEAMRKSDRAKYKGKSSFNRYISKSNKGYSISSKDAIQACAAGILGEPESAYSNPSNFYPGGKKYGDMFISNKSISSRKLFIPFMIKKFAQDILRYQKRKDANRNFQPLFRRRGTVFYVYVVFCLIKKISGKKISDGVEDQDVDLIYNILQHPSDLGTKFLTESDSIIKQFVAQRSVGTAIKEYDADFFKSHIKEHIDDLDYVIETWKDDPNNRDIIDEISNI